MLAYVAGDRSALITVWRRGFRLWVSSLALTAAWIVVYLIVVDQKRWSFDVVMTWDLLSRSITHGIVSGLVGGPWGWQRWAPASPWATPPVAVLVLGWIVLAAVLAVSLIRKQRVWPVWLVAAGYAVACQIPIYLMRSSRFTALELAQTLRYLPDLVVVLALLLAVVLPVSVVAACAIVVITLWIRRRRHVRVRRRAAESAALQGALDVVVGELRVGAHPAAAFGVAAGEIDGVVPASLRAVAARARLGADVPAGLHSMTRRSSMPAHWGRLAVCWQLPRITGWRSRR